MNEQKEIIKLVTLAGQIMLENGAETYRVEDTMERMCTANQIKHINTFVTPTGIFVSIETHDQTHLTTIRRVKQRITNLWKISEVNNISREFVNNQISINQALAALEKINKELLPSKLQVILAAGGSAGFFGLLLGASYWDGIIAAFCGAIIKSINVFSEFSQNTSILIINLIGGFISATIAILAATFLNLDSVYGIIIGAIMPFLPGIALTNAIRDIIYGDLVSGTARGIEAILIASSIATGVGIVLKTWMIFLGGAF